VAVNKKTGIIAEKAKSLQRESALSKKARSLPGHIATIYSIWLD
jgi:hypothetical protein